MTVGGALEDLRGISNGVEDLGGLFGGVDTLGTVGEVHRPGSLKQEITEPRSRRGETCGISGGGS